MIPATTRILGGIETGGTRCRVVSGDASGRIHAEIEIATGAPGVTLDAAADWLATRAITALGVAAFGPIVVDASARDFGTLLGTPKVGWSGVNLVAQLRDRLRVPIALDTDVNGAALAEATCGAGRGARNVAYFTVGTGVGLGLIIDGKPVHGQLHPEFGHFRPRRDAADTFPGTCAIHGDCLEGLVSGPALRARTGGDPAALPDDHPSWTFAASALGEAVAAIVLAASPERVILGGGVMRDGFLLPPIRAAARAALCGYPPARGAGSPLEDRIVSAALAPRSGAIGGLLLAAAIAPATLSGP